MLDKNLHNRLNPFEGGELIYPPLIEDPNVHAIYETPMTLEEMQSNATGTEVKILGMSPLVASLVGATILIGIVIGTIIVLNRK